MPRPADYPLGHAGWARAMDIVTTTMDDHPYHCRTCRDVAVEERRELARLKSAVADGEPCPRCTVGDGYLDDLTVAVGEVVDTWRGSSHPALRTVVRHLSDALNRRRR